MFKKSVKKKSKTGALSISSNNVTESKQETFKKTSRRTPPVIKNDAGSNRNTPPEGKSKFIKNVSLTPRRNIKKDSEKQKRTAVEEKSKLIKNISLSTPRKRNSSTFNSAIIKSNSTSQLCYTPISTRMRDSPSNITNKRKNISKKMLKLASHAKKVKPSISDQTKQATKAIRKKIEIIPGNNPLRNNIEIEQPITEDQLKNNLGVDSNERLTEFELKDVDECFNNNNRLSNGKKISATQNILRNRKSKTQIVDVILVGEDDGYENITPKTDFIGDQSENLINELPKNTLNDVELKDVNENFNVNKNLSEYSKETTQKTPKKRKKAKLDLSFVNNYKQLTYVDENKAYENTIPKTDVIENQPNNFSEVPKVLISVESKNVKENLNDSSKFTNEHLLTKNSLKRSKQLKKINADPELHNVVFVDDNIAYEINVSETNVIEDQQKNSSEFTKVLSNDESNNIKTNFNAQNDFTSEPNQPLTAATKNTLKSKKIKQISLEPDLRLINNENSIEDVIFLDDNITCESTMSKSDVIGAYLNDIKQEQEIINEQQCNETLVNSNVYCTVAKLDTDLDDVEFTEQIQLINENQNYEDFINTVKSPSAVSTDSAKGSSIGNDENCLQYKTGDLLWAQIFNYCYWPCIACPAIDGNVISLTSKNFVHVMFLADNCRTNFAKNIMPYAGLASYKRLVDEMEKTEGKKVTQNKFMVPNRNREQKWYEAVREATILSRVHHSERLEVLKEMYENIKLISKTKMKRRSTIVERFDEDLQIRDSVDDLSVEMMPISKRHRSISPCSPQYSPIKAMPKRTKLSLGAELSKEEPEPSNALNSSDNLNPEIFEDPNFKKLQFALKEFTMDSFKNDKYDESIFMYAKKIWSLKYMNKVEYEQQLCNSYNASEYGSVISEIPNDGSSVKRLSNRLKHIAIQRLSINSNQNSNTKPGNELVEKVQEEKVKRETTRPIEEVIDDLYNLDQKYLFRGITKFAVCKYCYKGGDNVIKCANECQSWLHVECVGMAQKYNEESSGKRLVNRRRSRSNSTTDSVLNIIPSPVNKNINTQNNSKTANQDAVLYTSTADNGIKLVNPNVLNQNNHEQTTVNNQICFECTQNPAPKCFVCKNSKLLDSDEETLICNVQQCFQIYHPSCCRYWPQAKIIKSNNIIQSFRCPSHVCHTCVSDDPRGKYQHLTKIIKCIRCPSSYHVNSHCIPAGSQILSSSYMICPRHDINKIDAKINVNWCFICVGAGSLVCCETCPIAVHAECANIDVNAKEPYICEECESGRLPLYGEMVWAKFNNFRWWPALILAPTEIPLNIKKKQHNPLDFVVRFFGTHDHCWISRRRIYLYMEGDDSAPVRGKKEMDKNYERGVKEAKKMFEIVNLKRTSLLNKGTNKLDPQPFEKIRSNRLVPPVKILRHLEDITICVCSPDIPHPCSVEANCINRQLLNECSVKTCPAGERCENRQLQSKIYPKLEVVHTKDRGFGLICVEAITSGSFIIEYVGEIINEEEFKRRISQKAHDFDDNYYYLSLEKDRIIDAGPKGNLARFINHSCQPNCEAQKWTIDGIRRIGLFAAMDILPRTELTFNYSWNRCIDSAPKSCFCGAEKCGGQIGAKYMEEKIKVSDVKDPVPQIKLTNKQKGRPRSTKTKQIKINSTKRSEKKN